MLHKQGIRMNNLGSHCGRDALIRKILRLNRGGCLAAIKIENPPSIQIRNRNFAFNYIKLDIVVDSVGMRHLSS